jgi:hypothetical protein
MALDPISPGAMPLSTMTLSNDQLRQAAQAMDEHLANKGRVGGVRLEKLRDGYARVVLFGPEGEPVAERLLWPVAFEGG